MPAPEDPLPALLARIGELPGFSARHLPRPTEPLLDTCIRAFGEAEAYSLWLGLIYAQVYAAPAVPAPAATGLLHRAGKLLHGRRAAAAATAFQQRLPDWTLAFRALLNALPAPALSLPPESQEPGRDQRPLPELGNALYGLYLDMHWTLYCHLPDKGQAAADHLADHLPELLRHEGLAWNNAGLFVLRHATGTHRRLAHLLDDALRGPYPAFSRWQVLDWTHELLHKERPQGLKTLARELTKLASAWIDAAFDQLLREAVLYDHNWNADLRQLVHPLAPALRFRRQPDRRAVLEALHTLGRTTPEARQLAALLAEVNQPETVPPSPAAPADAVHVPDVVLRLGIVHELMYEQAVLGPRFDVRKFAATYAGREIDVEHEGYAIIPEALAYFEQIPLTPALLDQVRELHFEYGKPPLDIVFQVFPFDDGEGNELQLTNLTGLKHCRRLEVFSLTELPPDFPPLDLTPLLALPNLHHVYLDPLLAGSPVYQELEQRGLLA